MDWNVIPVSNGKSSSMSETQVSPIYTEAYSTMSIRQPTPARIHVSAGTFVLRFALITNVCPRCWVLYTGHMKESLNSALSTGTAFANNTGIGKNISLGNELLTHACPASHLAPSIVSPWIYEPSFEATSTSVATFLVTSKALTTLSSG